MPRYSPVKERDSAAPDTAAIARRSQSGIFAPVSEATSVGPANRDISASRSLGSFRTAGIPATRRGRLDEHGIALCLLCRHRRARFQQVLVFVFFTRVVKLPFRTVWRSRIRRGFPRSGFLRTL